MIDHSSPTPPEATTPADPSPPPADPIRPDTPRSPRADGLPADWVDHPKIPITRRAVLAGIAIGVLGILGAVAGVWARRTRLEKTTAFWGADAIRAMQLGPRVTLRLEPVGLPASENLPTPTLTETAELSETVQKTAEASDPGSASPPEPQTKEIDLTGVPGLGHLRHAILDERHYDWETRSDKTIESLRSGDSRIAYLTFSDPLGKIPASTIALELTGGWVGTPPSPTNDRAANEHRSVRLIPRVQPAIRHFLVVISNAQKTYYDRRRSEEAKRAEAGKRDPS
jgi:hypothetical protein